MPPAKRVTEESSLPQSYLQAGQLVNLTAGGRTLFNYEILGWDANFIKFRGDLTVSPQTEVVLIPYGQIEAIGLVGVR
jgi:hypothetical protein